MIHVSESETGSTSHKWLESNLFPKLLKWMDSADEPQKGFAMASHSLVNAEEYNVKYNELKLKYGKRMVEVCPTSKLNYFTAIKLQFLCFFYSNRSGPKEPTQPNSFTRTWQSPVIFWCCGNRSERPNSRPNSNHSLTWDAEMVSWFTFYRPKATKALALMFGNVAYGTCTQPAPCWKPKP